MTTKDSIKSDTSVNTTVQTVSSIVDFIKLLMELTLCRHLKELKYHDIPQCIWNAMESKLNINKVLLKNSWYQKLHLQLFCTQPIYLNDIKVKLINYLYEKDITDSKDINWQHMTLIFHGVTKQYLYITYKNLLKHARIKSKSKKFVAQLKYLHESYINYLINEPQEKILPRLTYDNGKITYNEADLSKIMKYQYTKKENKSK